MIKKIISAFLLIAAILSFFVVETFAVEISAKSAVVIDVNSNEVLFEKNAYEKRSMASTTKIMTAILAIESGRLDETVDITAEMIQAEGTSIGLKAGYRILLSDLVYGMLLESGNDAANAVAIHLSKSVFEFSKLMNKKAAGIGMKSTNFVTASGLDDDEHYSTAYDMAVLSSYCVKNPVFRAVCSSKKHTAFLEKPEGFRLYFSNHNRLLSSSEGVFGVKTGFTKKSGRCLISAAEKGNASIIVVTLSAPDDWNDHRKLYNSCFEMYSNTTAAAEYPKTIPVIGGVVPFLDVKAEEESVELSLLGKKKVTQKVFLPKFIYAPIKKNDSIGRIDFYVGENIYKSLSLFAGESINSCSETYRRKESLLTKIKNKIKSLFSKGSVAAWQITE